MKSGFLPFIFLSATAHYAVLNHGEQWTLNLNENNEQGRSSLAIEIIHTKKKESPLNKPAENPQPETIEKKIVSIKENNTQTEISQSTRSVDISNKDNNISEKFSALEKTAEETVDTEKNTVIVNTINNLLKEELNKYFYYPKAAIRRNWQGKLVVSFIIHPDGSIDNIKISESSGYEILDNAAMESVKQIKLPVNDELSGLYSLRSDAETRLPVSYTLK